MDPVIAQSIDKALASRKGQREPAARLLAAWQDLGTKFDALLTAVEDAHRQFSADRQIQGARGIAGELDQWRRDEELLSAREDVARHRDSVAAIRDRAFRDTVNIGVVGQTGSGKSTFLQQVTNLPADVIPPANGPRPTTAARSRFLHSRDRADAEIKLLSWDEFRAKYTAPLHAEAGCPGPAPGSPESFLNYRYKERLATSPERQDSEAVSPQALLKRLIIAQDSFASYSGLLGAGTRTEPLAKLRPYVAYPEQDEDIRRPYHAVRDVLVYHPFVVDIEHLVFVDLPGTGETGLEVDQQFLADLTSEIDVLLHILRPLAGRSRLGKADDEILDLADHIKTGRDRADFICMIVNEDHLHNTEQDARAVIENVWTEAQDRAGLNRFTLVRGDVSDKEQARENILVPVLDHLARRLAAMDKAVAQSVARAAGTSAEAAAAVVGRLGAGIAQWQVDIPPEEQDLARKAKDLRDEIAGELEDLSRLYGQRAQAREPVPEVEESLAEVRRRLTDWVRGQFGAGWATDFKNKLAADAGEYKDDACTVVRQKLRYEFGQVDSSLDAARRRVQGEISGILRNHLGTTLVPEGDDSFGALLDATIGPGLGGLHSALAELVAFRTSYGSLFLRVGRPGRCPDHPGQRGGSPHDNAPAPGPGPAAVTFPGRAVIRSLQRGARERGRWRSSDRGGPAARGGVRGHPGGRQDRRGDRSAAGGMALVRRDRGHRRCYLRRRLPQVAHGCVRPHRGSHLRADPAGSQSAHRGAGSHR
ncbi:MAG TPA: hypothetical protein VN969_09925 [Streptosporangiaceae bacterium]|nr:hypothetical protein [Streptosporangiaceae bacterium]